MRRSQWKLCSLFFLVIQPVISFSQGNKCEDFPQGANSLESVSALRDYLRKGEWTKALELWYPGSRNCDLVDMIVYVDSAGAAKVGITRGHKTGHDFWGEKSMWVLVISDSSFLRDDPVPDETSISKKNVVTITDSSGSPDKASGKESIESRPDKESPEPAGKAGSLSQKSVKRIEISENTTSAGARMKRYSFRVTREALQYERGTSENTAAGVLALLMQLVSKATTSFPSPPDALKDSVVYLLLRPHTDAKGQDTIYSGIAKFNLALNTYNRVDVSPVRDLKFRSVQTHFGNYDNSPISVSIGVGYTVPLQTNGLNHASPDSGAAKFYIFGNLFLDPPRRPVSSASVAFTIGTNILANIFDDLIAGFRLVPGFEPVGVVVGVDWKLWTDHVRRGSFFLGLDYSL
jgi:hypothetical protein